ncbi:MAG: DUF2254 domain-containing protein [Gammaproteobacteria bacterium]|jgi:uncharacterized membrane protein
MFTKWEWLLSKLSRTLWIRALLIGLFGILVALIAIPIQSTLPIVSPLEVGARSVEGILQILATSMLTVTTFSLGAMVSAYNSASTGITPRAIKLVKQEPVTQNVLSSFIGAFLFSLVGIVALSSELYTESGRFILFVATLLVILLVIVALLRWIEHLSDLGRLSNTMDLVTDAARLALCEYARHPGWGCSPLSRNQPPPESANTIRFNQTGYIQHIDVNAVAELADSCNTEIGLLVSPGTLIQPQRPVAWYQGPRDNKLEQDIEAQFTLATDRSFDQDPRFGLAVLTEVALRALSPSVNDPGTAIDVIHRHLGLLLTFSQQQNAGEKAEILYRNLHSVPLSISDMFEDAFEPIARDGAGLLEVQIRLQKVLKILADNDPALYAKEAKAISNLAMDYVERSNMAELEKERLRRIADSI